MVAKNKLTSNGLDSPDVIVTCHRQARISTNSHVLHSTEYLAAIFGFAHLLSSSKMRYCSALNCRNVKGKSDCRSKTFFSFPLKDPCLLKKWLQNLGRKNFKPTKYSSVCSEHFEVAAVAEWYRHRIVAGFVTSSSPVPLKTRRVGQRCTLNLSRAETSSRWCGVVVRRGGASSGVVHVT
ncbi:uncharacterized protein TNCV_2369041 [Trichonephila clavipes]|nr:uncharacterized protein TNCV_2369041 [Trichonephila clavipes]